MGRVKGCILDGFSGKVGSVIGGNWGSVNYMPGKTYNRKKSSTDKQIEPNSGGKLKPGNYEHLKPHCYRRWIHLSFWEVYRSKSLWKTLLIRYLIIGLKLDK
jgi:hypothetical protein